MFFFIFSRKYIIVLRDSTIVNVWLKIFHWCLSIDCFIIIWMNDREKKYKKQKTETKSYQAIFRPSSVTSASVRLLYFQE